jgi:hypothetical protein
LSEAGIETVDKKWIVERIKGKRKFRNFLKSVPHGHSSFYLWSLAICYIYMRMFISCKGGAMTTVTASVARKSFGKILRETLHLLESPGFRKTLRNEEKEYSSGDSSFL